VKLMRVLLVASLTLLSSSGFAKIKSTTDLFIEVDLLTATQTSVITENAGILSKSNINVNVEALFDGSNVQGIASSNKAEAQSDTEEGFFMQLPDGIVVTLVTNRLQSYVEGVETYSGRVKDIETGHFTLSIEDGKVYGQVNIESMVYDIRYEKLLRSHVLTEIDQARMPHHTPEPPENSTTHSNALKPMYAPTPMLTSPDIGTVRVLILYASDVSNASTLASNIIAKMNDSFFDDRMDPDFHVTLAGLRALNDDFDGLCKESILDHMRTATAPFTNISTWISDDHADVVLTIASTVANMPNCTYPTLDRIGGIAYQYSALIDDPYVVTMDTYAIGDFTALHEIGHVLGGVHQDWSVTQIQSWYPDIESDSRGYMADDQDWQTIMGAYNYTGCDVPINLPADCVRIPLWSNPSKSYDGETRGQTHVNATATPFSANMASALSVQMPVVAAYESYPYSAPGTPSNIDVEECFSQNIVTWDATTNAEDYQVLYSAFSNFTNPEVIYFGSHEYVRVVVSQQSTKYIKIRSCNGSGCGSYSSTLTLTYNGYCS